MGALSCSFSVEAGCCWRVLSIVIYWTWVLSCVFKNFHPRGYVYVSEGTHTCPVQSSLARRWSILCSLCNFDACCSDVTTTFWQALRLNLHLWDISAAVLGFVVKLPTLPARSQSCKCEVIRWRSSGIWCTCVLWLRALELLSHSWLGGTQHSFCGTGYTKATECRCHCAVGIVQRGVFTFIWHLCTTVNWSVPCQSCVLCLALSCFCFPWQYARSGKGGSPVETVVICT